MFSRTRHSATWTPWIEYLTGTKTSWQNVNTRVTCKREGDRITVDIYKVNITKGTDQGIGTLPVGFRPNHELMFNVAPWVVNGETVKLQIDTDGGMIVLGQSISANREVRDKVDFRI